MSNSSFLLDDGERVEAVLAHLQANSPKAWRPHRILFRNFWFFQQEEFIWHHGRLFLGGQNAAGKSTVLSMAVPLLLDGNKNEERLNTFGGHGRHMSYYVTGSPNPDDTSEAAYQYPVRTSYMALEFYHQEEERYLCFGQGLHHDRSADDKSVRSWGFVVRDGRRPGRSQAGQPFDLVRENGASLTKAELKRLLNDGGEVFDTNLEYKREVNRLLFGFKDLHDYDALIDLLLQIRRPKLTKEIKPRDVAEILTQSLPTLAPGVMQVTSSSLDHIDQTTQNLERIDQQIQAALEIDKATQTVFRRMAEAAAAQFESDLSAAEAAGSRLQAHEAELERAQADFAQASAGLSESTQRKSELESERLSLQEAEPYQAADRLTALEQEIKSRSDNLHELRRMLRADETHLKTLRLDHADNQTKWHQEREQALAEMDGAASEAERARWEAARSWLAELRVTWSQLLPDRSKHDLVADIPKATVDATADERLAQIDELRSLVDQRDRDRMAWDRAKEKESETQERFFKTEAEVTALHGQVQEARQTAAVSIDTWSKQSSTLGVNIPPEPVVMVASGLQRYLGRSGEHPQALLDPLRQHLRYLLGENATAIAQGQERLRGLGQTKEELQAERRRLDQAPPVPDRTEIQVAARAALTEAGIPFAPLYETLDFVSGLSPAAGGALEQGLLQIGLLDALVVWPSDRTAALSVLADHGMGEQFLAPAMIEQPPPEPGQQVLHIDASHPMGEATGPILTQIGIGDSGKGIARLFSDSTWQHGLLTGVPVPMQSARYIGRTARERFRLSEIQRLETALTTLQGQIDHEGLVLTETRAQTDRIQSTANALEDLAALKALHNLCTQVELRQADVEVARREFEQAQQQTAVARQNWDQAQAALLQHYRLFPAGEGLTRDGLADLATATRNLRAAFDQLYQHARVMGSQLDVLERISDQIASQELRIDERKDSEDHQAIDLREREGQRAGLQHLLDQPGAQALFTRLQEIAQELTGLSAQISSLNRKEAVAQDRCQTLAKSLPDLIALAQCTAITAANARVGLKDAIAAYPSLEQYRVAAADDEGARKVARTLLSRWVQRPTLAQEIREQETKDRSALSEVFHIRRQILRNFYPEYQAAERSDRLVRFMLDGVGRTPHDLSDHLQTQAETLRNVLHKHEADLFERHLLQDVGREVRRCMLKARDWVDEIKQLLARYPLRNDERVDLEWEPKRTEHELGGTIARQAELLRIDESLLTPAQRDVLRSAFQEEVRLIREQAKRGEWRADLFRERLAEVLDYRTWFRFRIFVRGGTAGRTEITDTVHNARSGSERALVLLLPLIAGLSVRYDNAAPSAPRLLALDEGFAGIDAVNSRQLIRFLVALQLTWVVTSEKPPAVTDELTGASYYSMLREGTVVATRAFYWNGERMVDAELAQPWEDPNHAD